MLKGQLSAIPAATRECGPCVVITFDLLKEAGNLQFYVKYPNS